MDVTMEGIESAATLLHDVVRPTPIEDSRWLGAKVGGSVYLKCENLQRAGSFKIRGAYVRIARMSAEERQNGVVAASAGNHAQGVALAASMLDTRATVFMPDGAPIVKERATRAYGADVRFAGTTVDDALLAARAFAAETGAVLIHPFDHPDIVAGQATVGMEILQQCPDVRTILVGAGGGGLLAGVMMAVQHSRPDVRVVGVQAEGAAAYPPSLGMGAPVSLERMSTMADGIAVGCPGDVPFDIIRAHHGSVITVSEEALSQALVSLLERAKQVVEPAGAAAVAALLEDPGVYEPPVVAVLSGGNIDPLLLMRVIRHGMAAAGRYLSIRVRVPDAPGALAKLLGELASVDANVLDVVHQRTSASLPVDQVEVALHLETRGPEHRSRVIARLRHTGYPLSLPED
ncbi:threonine ammonia-lyase [Actinobacteria bacterium YIM 96077]|uniref:threonine ammonia-lyase n=1 Tax=Phytoactinopolyspora halophila TaxID=1981511 RepID=A0A329QJ12_9ACTN|nr:threonine ammonia-lyase [Phytoactinopolyspora halophila]AYY14366.1 threonine ammonia-lyase [Actinobacteria bacterium YIM 96077]RAW11911.1 threonine ammonia-lyase [Phytoactinopolyspora halophila]